MISVILATHNGADTIERTLAAMSEMDAPAGGWKLIVVNNASTDDTESRILKWREHLPLEYVVEPRLGKSKAVNTAFRYVEGDFIIMTDDDVLPDRNWLTEWRRVADSFPEYSIFGGAVVPHFDALLPPSYIPAYCYGALYGASPHYPEGKLEPARDTGLFEVSGANIAIRRSVCEQGCRFDERFLVGSDGLMGEDTEFVKRLGASGYKVGFTPNARIRHIVHEYQTSWRWMHKRFFRNGRATFLLINARWNETSGKFVFRFPWPRIRTATGSFLRLVLATLRSNRKNAFLQSHSLAYDLGAIRQALALYWHQRFL